MLFGKWLSLHDASSRLARMPGGHDDWKRHQGSKGNLEPTQ
jgi:hypothetical protein